MKMCNVEFCKNKHHAKGYCKKHYNNLTRKGSYLDKPINEDHGMYLTREYNSWCSMKTRCLNKSFPMYKNYGGRSITICDEWRKSFLAFYRDMGKRPENTSLDRIDNEKGYSKENCRWSTRREQSINRRIQSNNKSGHKGISFYKKNNKWRVSFKENGLSVHVGYFETLEKAIKAKDAYKNRA